MYIKKVELEKFRAFENKTSVELGSGITCIAGLNGTGKSTILATLGNCGELKASEGKHLNGKRFHASYSELIRKDTGDESGPKARLFFGKSNDNEVLEVEDLGFRATTQTDHDRYRLIPIKNERGHERKLKWPTFYLGLSRLYPVGESDSAKTATMKLSEEESRSFIGSYKAILSSNERLSMPTAIKFNDAKKKVGATISTDKYGDMANSAGQDNLGQILLTVISFSRLKDQLGEKYNGGLFLIDEIDATLHPAAQNKLYKYLSLKAKELHLQIIFTTHSLSLIQYIHETAALSDKNEFAKLLYLNRERGNVEVEVNPSLKSVKSGLRVTMSNTANSVKIPLLTEDPIAAEFSQWILSKFYDRTSFQPSKTSMSFEQMAKLVKSFPDFFFDSLVIFDADVKKDNNSKIVAGVLNGTEFIDMDPPRMGGELYRRYFYLPGQEPVETMMWKLCMSLDVDDELFYNDLLRKWNISKQTLLIEFEEEFRNENRGRFKELELHKRWFEHKTVEAIRPLIYERWMKDNFSECCTWSETVIEEYLKIGKRLDISFEVPTKLESEVPVFAHDLA